MKTQTENVVVIYNDADVAEGIIKRDSPTGKKLIYKLVEADIEEIEYLINPAKTLI